MSASADTRVPRRLLGPCLALLLVIAGTARAQNARPDTSLVPAVLPAGDTVAVRERIPPLSADTAAVHRRRKSTGTAMLLSALLPGAGQFYNESYWKVPVVMGLGIYFASGYLQNNRDARSYRALYTASLLPGAPDAYLSYRYLQLREFYKDQRDSFTWYFVILYLVNLADAYVDAALFDFNVGSDLSLQQLPGLQEPPHYSLTVRFRF